MANLSNINNKFLVTTGGNVGIGDTGPSTRLTVDVPAILNNTVNIFQLGDDTNGLVFKKFWDSGGIAWRLNKGVSGINMMTFSQNGNVGIGNDDPSYKLSVDSGGANVGIKVVSTDPSATIAFKDDTTTGDNVQCGAVGNDFKVLAGGGTRLKVTSNGNLEILGSNSGASNNQMKLIFDNSDVTVQTNQLMGGIEFKSADGSGQGAGIKSSINTIFTGTGGYNDMIFSTAGTDANNAERMRIDSLGNVGIGTTSPTTALTIRKAISPTAYGEQASMIEFKSYYTGYDTETVKSAIYSGVSSQTTLQTTRGFMSFWTADYVSGGGQSLTEKMRIESNGNVGIGTSSPDTLLHVSNNSSNSQLTIERIGTAPGKYGFYTNTGNLFINNITGGASTIPMIILNNGNVGIGAGNPSSKLAIDGGFDYPTVRWFSSNNTSRYMQVGMITPTEHSIRAYGSSSELTFWTASSFSMVIDGGGNVGIGITNPQDKLHVSGDAIISSTRHGDFAVASISTTGYAIANVGASTNGQSAIVEFVASGNNGGYYNVVYSCYNGGGLWYYAKNVVGSGGNIEVAETNGSGSSTLVFYFRATSGGASYTPRVMMKGMPYNLVTF